MKKQGKKPNRKHWSEYGPDGSGYGNWRIEHNGKQYYGFGIYLMNKQDAWLDFECASTTEKRDYKAYCKARGFKYNEGEI